jgi:hypothetical protein
MSDNSTNIANLPKFGSFWSRPEGKLGAVTLVGLGLAALGALYVFGPILLSIIWTTTKIAALCGGLFGAWIIGSNKKFQNLIANMFAAAMDKAVRAFVKTDPYGVVRRYIKYLKERILQMATSIAAVMGQNQNLKQLIDTQIAQMKTLNGILEQARKRYGDEHQSVKGNAIKIGRLKKATELLKKEWERNQRVVEVLKKLRENAEFVVEDTESAVELQIRTHAAVTASHMAFNDAMVAINGDSNKKEMFDASMMFMAEDVAGKIGQIEMGFETIQGALTNKDLENDAAAADVLRQLDETERSAEGLRAPGGTHQHAVADARHPVTVGGGTVSEFDSLFKTKN